MFPASNSSEQQLSDFDLIKSITWDDATWILSTSFIIFTMQSGFGLLESGLSSAKNEVNVMVKNVVDVVFGGLSYWLVGFGLTFGDTEGWANPFCGWGYFAVHADEADMGWKYSWFIFQFSFATTSTTIVSGAMAERAKLSAYIMFSFFNTFIYVMPARWLHAEEGFLRQLGAIDIAGAGTVHLVGGMTGLIATLMLKPRINRFGDNQSPTKAALNTDANGNNRKGVQETPERVMGCPTNAILGMFMLWWGWLGFNCGSTYGISGGKWKLAARSAVVTIMSTVGGGVVGILGGYVLKGYCYVPFLINGILSSLVSVTGICALAHPWQALVIGSIGAVVANSAAQLVETLKIDDPVGVIPIHFAASIWGLISVGLFVQEDTVMQFHRGHVGVLSGGGWNLLFMQTITIACLMTWSALTSTVVLLCVDKTVGLRVSAEEEALGSDYVEHKLGQISVPTEDVHVSESTKNGLSFSRPASGRWQRAMLGLRHRSGTQASRISPEGGNTPVDAERTKDIEKTDDRMPTRVTSTRANGSTSMCIDAAELNERMARIVRQKTMTKSSGRHFATASAATSPSGFRRSGACPQPASSSQHLEMWSLFPPTMDEPRRKSHS